MSCFYGLVYILLGGVVGNSALCPNASVCVVASRYDDTGCAKYNATKVVTKLSEFVPECKSVRIYT